MANISNKAKGLSSIQHIKQSHKTGDEGERRFYDSCKAAGLSVKKTNAKKDMKHIDFIVDGKSFDVKGLKKSHRNGEILVELKNVNGKTGWCNKNNTPEYIAFDFGAFFLCVYNLDLYNMVLDLCNLKNKVSKIEDCLYKAYQRKDRQDLITLVKLQDVLNTCSHKFIPYQEYRQPMDIL
jgi:hypothetical protein